MRRTLLAFFGLSFIVYRLWTADLPTRQPRAFSVQPILSQPPGKLELFVRNQLGGDQELDTWLKAESARLGRIDANPDATLIRLRARAARLSPYELAWLKKTAVEVEVPGDERFLAVYIISLSESAAALDQLKEIAFTQIATPPNDRAYSDEVVVRAHALDSLIHRLPAADAVRYLRELLSKSADPGVARHARYWLSHLG